MYYDIKNTNITDSLKQELQQTAASKKLSSLDEYKVTALNMISKYANKVKDGLRKEFSENEDALSSVIYNIILADLRFDGRGNKHGYRKYMAICAMKTYLSNKIRKIKKNKTVSLEVLDHDTEDYRKPLSMFQKAELKTKLDTVIKNAKLGTQATKYIVNRYYDEMPVPEIADKYGISRQAVYKSLDRSLKKLRKMCANEVYFEV